MIKIKILFLVRPDLEKLRAGDTIQITNLKKYLEMLGFKITISSERKPDLSGVDLVNCFNLLRVDGIGRQCCLVKAKGKPLIITPIYWNMEEYLRSKQPDLLETWRYWQKQRKAVLQLADLVTPAAETELLQLKMDFHLEFPSRIIHNGVDPFFYGKCYGGRKDLLQKCKTDRSGVISVGRVHSQKNQLTLIRALQSTEIPLTIIGEINDPGYYQGCINAANKNTTFVKHMPQQKLLNHYLKARVHVLVSWFETPGLVNLEAGLAGCSLVTTSRGTTREYLKEYSLYCDPQDQENIRESILQAYEREIDPSQISYIYQHFSWKKVAEEAAKIYKELVAKSKRM